MRVILSGGPKHGTAVDVLPDARSVYVPGAKDGDLCMYLRRNDGVFAFSRLAPPVERSIGIGNHAEVRGGGLTRSFQAGIVQAIVADDWPDIHGRALDLEGGDWTDWLRNGSPVLYSHGGGARGREPIGQADSLELVTFHGRRCLFANIRFYGDDEFSRNVGQTYRSRLVSSWSIGTHPLEEWAPTSDERQRRPEWRSASVVYRKWRLKEISATDSPANLRATTISVVPASPGPIAGRTIVARSMTPTVEAETFRLVNGVYLLLDAHGRVVGKAATEADAYDAILGITSGACFDRPT